MSQPQFIPNPAYVQPRYGSVFGLGITTGILAILSSLWLALLGIGLLVYAQSWVEYGGGRLFVISGILGAVLSAFAVVMFVLGILAIVKNRMRGVKLLATLLVVAVASVVVAVIAGALGYAGTHFSVLTTVIMLPLIILSLLAALAARRTANQSAPRD
ncbi:hypothetical protein [Arthrobacter sp. N1]|uniref:hypothetical protein n=1 Tax=Arthrobacter sp. N1 TaxID=619291 RepID=UPI003BB17E91